MLEKNKTKRILQCFLICICLVFIAKYFINHKDEFLLVKNISMSNLLTLTILLMLSNLTVSFKMLLILKNLGLKELELSKWFKIFIASRFINFHITQGANLYRIAVLKKHYNFSYPKGIGMSLYFTWLEILMILVTTFAYIALFTDNADTMITSVQNLLFLMFVLIFLLPFLTFQLLKFFTVKKEYWIWLKSKLWDMSQTIMLQIRNYPLIKNFALLSVISYFFYFVIVYVSFHSIHIDLRPSQVGLFTAVLVLSRTIYVLPGNLGLAELICGTLSEPIGITLGSGMLVASLFRIMDYLVVMFLNMVSGGSLLFPGKTVDVNN